jgi:hypothetical protein
MNISRGRVLHVSAALLAATLLAVSPAPSTAPSPDAAARILAARSAISFSDGKLAGPGAGVLRDASAGAQFVMLGEDHGTRQIAEFAGALFESLAPRGFDTIAIETGPVLAAKLRAWLASSDGRAQYATFESAHGGTTAFYGWQDEYEFLARATRITGGALQLWGLDQELMGASKFLLESILAQRPGPRSTALIHAMLAQDAIDYAKAAQNGDPGQMFLLQVDSQALHTLKASLEKDGNARSQKLVAGLIATRDIYANCCNSFSAQSNRDRALLMKQTLVAYLNAGGAYARPPKIFFKFGGEHLYRGLNPLNNFDLGNYVTEISDGLGLRSMNVLVLGTDGKQSRFAGIGKPWADASYKLGDEDHDIFAFLAPFVQATGTLPALYDLRLLRKHFSEVGIADKEYARMVYGYDFLVLIPNTTADPPIAPSAF